MFVIAPSEGDIRLVDISSREGEGLVEMYYPRRAYRWSTVCTNGWDDVEAKVVCQQLGYRTGKSKFYRYTHIQLLLQRFAGCLRDQSWRYMYRIILL